jgi:hypothetical protein
LLLWSFNNLLVVFNCALFVSTDVDVQIEKAGADGAMRTVELTWKRGRLFDKFACAVLCEMCTIDPTIVVTKVEAKPAHK